MGTSSETFLFLKKMSSAAEIEQKGVTIINKVEHFGSEVESRYLQYCMSRFQFPLFPDSKLVLDYSLKNDLSSDFYVYLSRYASGLGPEKVLELSGTFSVVTSDGAIHMLGIFFDHILEMNKVIEFKLKNLSSITSYAMEEMFPNDVLTLRCHIWKSFEEEERKYLKICYISRCVVEKCSFEFIIDEFEEKLRQGDQRWQKFIPWTFKSGKEILKLNFYFENFSDPEPICRVELSTCEIIYSVYSSKIILECTNGSLVTFSENKNYIPLFYSGGKKLSLCIKMSELKERKDFFHPNSTLRFICYFKFVSECSIIKESADYGDPRDLDSNQDCSAVNIEEDFIALEKEDQTLSDSLYSLYNEEKFCDVTLRTKHLLYPSHRAVLGARSEFFRVKFENNLKEKDGAIIDLDDDPQTLKVCLRYLYTDKVVVLELEDLLKLFAMADKYIIPSLKKRCITLLLSRMSVKYACETLIMADMHNADDLKKALEIFICNHAKEIINSDDWKILKDQFPLLALETMDKFCNKVL